MSEEYNRMNPVIVSASRSTDVPAFYSDWFMERLKAGYSVWVNPFNQERYRVSFADTRMIVFWSKNPRPLYERLDELHGLGYKNYYFQFTLNNYEPEGLEPRVPPIEQRIETFRALAEKIGKARVIWRYDPLMLSSKLTIPEQLKRIGEVGHAIKGCTEKLVFSFADITAYRKVSRNLDGTTCREFSNAEKQDLVTGLVELNKSLGLELATCAEDIDLERYGVKHNKCVDDDLMMRLFNSDGKLMDCIGAEYDMFDGWSIKKSKKDKGQRKACGCIVSKDIGMYNTCPHLCRYCYANASDTLVLSNWAKSKSTPGSETLVP